MASTPPSYTKLTHSASYPAIDPTRPGLSTADKVVVITGASGGIGRATAKSFAASGPRALVLLGRRSEALAETAALVQSSHSGSGLVIQTHEVDLCDAQAIRAVADKVAGDLGGIDILVHCAGVLASVVPLLEADPATFLDGYKTTVVGTLAVAQAIVLANKKSPSRDAGKELTFLHLTTAGILFPPFPGMGAYVSSKMAAVKLMQAFAAENPRVRLHHVHPGFLDTAMSTQLSKSVQLPFAFDDSEYISIFRFVPSSFSLYRGPLLTTYALPPRVVSLPSDFLVWVATPEASFLNGKLVFSAWDVEELKARKKEIVGGPPGTGELWIGFQGFPRYMAGNLLPGK